MTSRIHLGIVVCFALGLIISQTKDCPASDPAMPHWVWTTAHAIPKQTTNEGSGYFSLIEGHNGRLYIGTAKYGHNAYLVEFDRESKAINVVVDAHKEIGTTATGFAAQAKIHTRNNVGKSGKIYFATKQGYPKTGETRKDYPGGYPMVYDPQTQKTKVYPIPIPHQGVISITPDESRGIAYISTCSDERPIESAHFGILDLKTGNYYDLMDCKHPYAFIVVDHLGRAYHPVLGGKIARYDPNADRLEILTQTIDGKPLPNGSLFAHPTGHPINWDISPDRKTLYAVAMSGNQLYRYDLTQPGKILNAISVGALIPNATKTDCRAMCVAKDDTVWAGVKARREKTERLYVVRYRPGEKSPITFGPLAISNPDYTSFVDEKNQPLKWHHGVHQPPGEPLQPRYVVMGICATSDDRVYLTTLAPFTLHELKIPKVAGITTVYRHNSHADVILSRLIETDTLDFKGAQPSLELTSLYVDQLPKNDKSHRLSNDYQVSQHSTIAKALTNGSETLNVDGVLMVAEHGDYDESETGQILYPKRRLFGEIAETFRKTGRVVPVFSDKHLADNWEDAKWIYDTARDLKIPFMAGSSLPVLWREPAIDLTREARVKEIVAISYHRLDSYGFHALEMVQCLAERRRGGETGVASVQCLVGEDVWDAGRKGVYDQKLLDAALERLTYQPWKTVKPLKELCPNPVLFSIQYRDGLTAHIFTLSPAVREWSVAWRENEDPKIRSTRFQVQNARPYHHFNYLLRGIEKMMQTGVPTWPVERTLLTTGMLDALLISKQKNSQEILTPYLKIHYQSKWNWQQPPPSPGDRPSRGQ